MNTHDSNTNKSTVITVQITSEVSGKLEPLARDTKRSKAYLAGEAISSYVKRNAWQVARIKESLEDAKSGTSGIPHSEMERWVKSWGTENELPPPEPIH